jgi:uncharacterized membrane protein YagU involved in acid resistance
MTATALPLAPSPARVAGRAVLAAALAVWLLDGMFATGLCLSLSPTCTVARTWQGVAGALVGRPATFEGGAATFALGLLLHFCVALGWSALYALLVARWDALARFTARPANVPLAGAALGAVVWCVMNSLVVPLTRNAPTPFGTRVWWILLAGHLVVVGPPIALLVRRGEANSYV